MVLKWYVLREDILLGMKCKILQSKQPFCEFFFCEFFKFPHMESS